MAGAAGYGSLTEMVDPADVWPWNPPWITRGLAAAVAAGCLVVLSACGHSQNLPTGSAASAFPELRNGSAVVTGTAEACTGPVPASGSARLPVQVLIKARRHTEVSETVLSGQTYRLVVPPGQYLVTSKAAYVIPAHITVSSGETVQVNLPTTCK